ncbi:protein kinase domain-containing protein [Acidihalobacter prosperus]
MSLFRDFRAERRVARALALKELTSSDAQRTLQKLKDSAAEGVPRLVRLLVLSDRSDKNHLVQLLTRILDNKTLDYFCQALRGSDPRTMQAVVGILRGRRNYDPNLLLEYLGDTSMPKAALLEVLSAHSEALDAQGLLRQIGALDPSERNAAFRLLDEIADEALVPELINRATAKDLQIRQGIARILGRFDMPAAHEALKRLLDDPSKSVRQAALEALSAHATALDVDTLFRLLHDADITVQNQAVDGIIRLNHPDTLRYVIDILRDESEYVRRAGVEVLNEVGDVRAIKDLLNAIKDDDWWVRARAADALARIGGPRVIQAVVELLRDDDEFIRRSAVEILNSIKDEASFKHLIDALKDSDWWVRERAVDALANLGNKAAIPALLPLLKSDASTVVVTLRALAKLGDATLLKHVLDTLKRAEPTVRTEALLTLVELTDADRLEWVLRQIDDLAQEAPEEEIREVARDSASRLRERFEMADAPSSASSSLGSSRPGSQGSSSSAPARSESDSVPSVPVVDSQPITLNRLRAGEMLGDRYRYIRRVGRGAFGTVVLVDDLTRGENVILKFLHAQMASDENMVKRFQREHNFAKRIEHHNIIRIYDFFMLSEMYVISMEYFSSTPLSAEIKAKVPLSLERSLHIIYEVASGMMAAHAMGIVHRDLKPGNILINEHNVVKVVDFGVAAAVDGTDTRLTRTGLLVGTPRYMAPEQVLGKPVDERTDIYSLGVIFYEMLTGSSPYSGDDNVAVMYKHVQGGAQPPHERNPEVSRTLSALVLRMMAAEPERRFKSMADVRRTLEPFITAGRRL